MRMNRALVCLFAILISVPAASGEAQDPWVLAATEYHEVASEAIGRSFNVWVSLPADYEPDGRTEYPTLYVLDGGIMFPMLASYSRYLQFGDGYSPLIIVGIGYPGVTFEEGNFRSTDYTAPSSEREWYGGAGRFQAFLGNTLMPFIQSEYRSDPDRQAIYGQSIAGQFVLFTAQTRPELFYGHIASNPALHRNLDFFIETRPENDSKTRLLIASADGDDRRFKVPFKKWLDHWQSVEDPHWKLKVVNLEGHTHLSAPPEAIRHGLQWLFPQ